MDWRKSSYSGHNGTCVELAWTLDRVRDSKNPSGPPLSADLAALIDSIKRGRFDHTR